MYHAQNHENEEFIDEGNLFNDCITALSLEEVKYVCEWFLGIFFRYGDALNPWGDIIAIARGWCVTKDQGSLTLGFAYHDSPKDFILFNAGRYYGHIRYPYVVTNWEQLYRAPPGRQQIFVFKKVDGHSWYPSTNTLDINSHFVIFYRAWQINRINVINNINRFNNGFN